MSDSENDGVLALKNGTIVRGYRIEAELHRGRFAAVYRARHEELGATAVLKEYLPEGLCVRKGDTVRPLDGDRATEYGDGRQRFLENARHLAKLRGNQGVVACLDFFAANGTAYVVMEHVAGLSLAELLSKRSAQGRPLDEVELLSIIRPLLAGLGDIHAAGRLHGGIEPSHVLLHEGDRRPVLTGWSAETGGPGQRLAEGYAAIEQASDGEMGAWTDLYAVASMMWRVVAEGSPPWQPPDPVGAEKRMDAVIRRRPDPLPPAMRIGSGRFADETLKAIDKCLQLPELDRFQSCAELLEALPQELEASPAAEPLAARGADLATPGSQDESARGWLERMFRGRRTRPTRVQAVAASTALMFGIPLGFAIGGLWSAPVDPTNFSRLVIETEPPDAQIRLPLVDGSYWPRMVLPDGQYKLEVSAEGYETETLLVEHGSEPATHRVSLRRSAPDRPPAPAEFTIAVEPESARIRLLGIEQRYQAGMALPAGPYQVEVSAEGYETEILAVEHGTAPTNERVSLRRPAVPRFAAAFTIEARPLDARVRVLNIAERYQPGMALPAGPYQVEVSAEGYETTLTSVRHGTAPTTEQIVLQRIGAGFTIEVEPPEAFVRFFDLDDAYVPGMSLPEGEYRVEISAQGYETLVKTVRHGGEPTLDRAVLQQLAEVPKTFEFVRIPAGELRMGSASAEADDDEQPVTRVRVSRGFEMTRFEVTQEQWESVMKSNPSQFSGCGSNCPVENVSWDDVQDFVAKLNAAAGEPRFRLPTEAEWEYAARAGTTEDRYGDLDDIGWWDGNAGFGTHPVGRKEPNGFGLYDMVGNVYEWVQDWYGEYPGGSVADPTGRPFGSHRVARGGGWSGDASDCRVTNRYAGRADVRLSFVGLRVVRITP